MYKQFPSLLFLLTSGLLALSVLPQAAHGQIEEAMLWRDAVVSDLDVDFDGTGFHARWRYHRCDCGDLQVMVEQVAPDDMLTGELLMVDGQVLLSKGFEQQGEDIEPLIQAPSLMLQLAFELLTRSQPDGPASVNKKQAWNKREKSKNFHLDTGLATGAFAAPWSVKGSGWRAGSDHVRFEFVFGFTSSEPGQPVQTSSITFSGDLDFGQQDFPYPGTALLEDWRVQWISKDERKSNPAEEGLTLNALREKTRNQ